MAQAVAGSERRPASSNAKVHYTGLRMRGGGSMAIVSTTSRGQVTLRKEIFQHVGIKPGEKLEIELLPGGEFRGRAAKKWAASRIWPGSSRARQTAHG